MSKVDEEALVAIKEMVDAGLGVSITKYHAGYETTIFSRHEKTHSHFQDDSMVASIMKARKTIETL